MKKVCEDLGLVGFVTGGTEDDDLLGTGLNPLPSAWRAPTPRANPGQTPSTRELEGTA